MEDNKKLLEQNRLLQKEIFRLQDELHQIKQNNDINIFKKNIYNLIEEIENNKFSEKDIYLYINNIKNKEEMKINNNLILQKYNYLLDEIEHNYNKDDFINKLKLFI